MHIQGGFGPLGDRLRADRTGTTRRGCDAAWGGLRRDEGEGK